MKIIHDPLNGLVNFLKNNSAGHSLAQLINTLSGIPLSHRQYILDQLWPGLTAHLSTPVISGPDALFISKGAIKSVRLSGDRNNWTALNGFSRFPGTDLFYFLDHYEENARLDYKLLIDGVLVTDPLNPSFCNGGFGPNSELRMPAFNNSKFSSAHVSADRLVCFKLDNPYQFQQHNISVYLPPDYQDHDVLPAVYFQDGREYMNQAQAVQTIEGLIMNKMIPSCIAVFVDPVDRGRDYAVNTSYARFFMDTVIPFIEKEYRVSGSPSQRYIVGDSMGGLISLYMLYLYPSSFHGFLSHSGAYPFAFNKTFKFCGIQYNSSGFGKHIHDKRLCTKIAMTVGTYETLIVGHNFLKANRRLASILPGCTDHFRYSEFPQGHSWGLWRDTLGEGLVFIMNQ